MDICKYCFLQGLDLPGVMVESEKQGIPFEKLLAIPEKDDWEYSDGFSTTCVAFILQMYKEAGLFDSLATSIQVTEFTVRANLFSFIFIVKDCYSVLMFSNLSIIEILVADCIELAWPCWTPA